MFAMDAATANRRLRRTRRLTDGAMSESQLQTAIWNAAELYGWKVSHVSTIGTVRQGRRVHMTPAAVGFPDLVLARNGKTLFIECKSERGRATPEQKEWLAATNGWLIRPRHLDFVLDYLRFSGQIGWAREVPVDVLVVR